MRPEQKPGADSLSGKVADVEVIQETGTLITKRENIKKYVEAPLVTACEILWDKNIKTVWSSCNAKDFSQGYGVIGIDYESLSDENKKIADHMGEVIEDRLGKTFYIKIPLAENTTTEESKKISTDLANKFKKQKASWVKGYTQDEMIRGYLLIRNIDDEVRRKYPIKDFVNEDNYLDEKADPPLIYPSKELYEKTIKNKIKI